MELPRKARKTIAIMSGKGGAGKSTIAGLLAAGLQREYRSVGLLDGDLISPALLYLFGLEKQLVFNEQGQIEPLTSQLGIKCMAFDIFQEHESDPLVWRGPMIMKTVQQFVQNVKWGELDVLLIDLPPGTGDAQLSLVQTLPLDGALLVTTPQPAATNVARKGGLMFQKVNVPLLGVAENMSYFVDPAGNKHTLFGSGGGIATAERLGTALLGQVPLVPEIRAGGDTGEPIVVGAPQSAAAEVFREIAATLLGKLTPRPLAH